jgi:hypothetical protein
VPEKYLEYLIFLKSVPSISECYTIEINFPSQKMPVASQTAHSYPKWGHHIIDTTDESLSTGWRPFQNGGKPLASQQVLCQASS